MLAKILKILDFLKFVKSVNRICWIYINNINKAAIIRLRIAFLLSSLCIWPLIKVEINGSLDVKPYKFYSAFVSAQRISHFMLEH